MGMNETEELAEFLAEESSDGSATAVLRIMQLLAERDLRLPMNSATTSWIRIGTG
jgi:hypothetical protein